MREENHAEPVLRLSAAELGHWYGALLLQIEGQRQYIQALHDPTSPEARTIRREDLANAEQSAQQVLAELVQLNDRIRAFFGPGKLFQFEALLVRHGYLAGEDQAGVAD